MAEPTGPEGSRYEATISLGPKLKRIRWSWVRESFYEEAIFSRGEVSFHPMIHLHQETPPFTLKVKVEGASITHTRRISRGDAGSALVESVDRDRESLEVKWHGDPPQSSNWGRWIFRCRVRNQEGVERSIYIGFFYLSETRKRRLLRNLTEMSKQLSARDPNTIVRGNTALIDTNIEVERHRRIKMVIKLDGDEVPYFMSAPGEAAENDTGEEIFLRSERSPDSLPKRVHLEPMFVLHRPETDFEFAFSCSSALAGAKADPCDPETPLALEWFGVTDRQEDCPAGRGFKGSRHDRSHRKAGRIRWREPRDGKELRVATFFFQDRDLHEEARPDGEGVLIDPTVLYDEDDPPTKDAPWSDPELQRDAARIS